MPCNRIGLRHRRGGPGDVAHVPRSHPQAASPVLTTLRAACLFLRSKVVTLRAPCLFLLQCKVEYKTHALQGRCPALRALCPRTSTDWHGRHGSSKAADRPGIVPVPDAMQSSDIKLACDLKADGRNPEYLAVFHSKPWNFKDLRILYNESENQDITGGLTDGGDGSGAGSDA